MHDIDYISIVINQFCLHHKYHIYLTLLSQFKFDQNIFEFHCKNLHLYY